MKRLFTFLLLLILSMTWAPVAVRAHDVVSEQEIPKGVAGADGIACHYSGSYGGHSFSETTYIGADAGMMTSDSAREMRWQDAECRRTAERAITGFFKWSEGLDLPADQLNIKVTIKRV